MKSIKTNYEVGLKPQGILMTDFNHTGIICTAYIKQKGIAEIKMFYWCKL